MSKLNRLLGGAVLAAAFTLGASAQAQAQSARAVERSGATFHVEACPGPTAPGTARCHAHVVTDSQGVPIVTDSRGRPLRGPPIAGTSYTAAQLRAAYGIPKDNGAPGSGPTVAVVDAYGYPGAESDLAQYRSTMSLGDCTTANGCLSIVGQDGGAPPTKTNLGWEQETALDLDMVSAMCPSCKILLVEADSNNFTDLSAAVQWAAGQNVIAISNSYGGSEGSWVGSVDADYQNPNGVVTASTGDSGYGVQFPASGSSVTATGGTTLHYSTSSRTETAWSGAGSGCSSYIGKPPWQSTIPDSLCPNRAVADVSADADPNTGVKVYGPTRRGSGWLVFGGTSVASPLIAGVYAEAVVQNNSAAPTAGGVYGNASSLHDITSGSNGSCGGTALCTSVTGWDGPTGLGTPDGLTDFQ